MSLQAVYDKIFDKYDTDHDGYLDIYDFDGLFREYRSISHGENEDKDVFKAAKKRDFKKMDTRGDGRISKADFIRAAENDNFFDN